MLVLVGQAALGNDVYPLVPPSPPPPGQGFAQPGPAVAQPPASAWPPPGPEMGRTNNAGPQDWLAVPDRTAAAPVVPCPMAVEKPTDSTWYFRQDAFYWNERSGGVDFVNEYGPLSTLGYMHHAGIERFRLELFGGTVAYDGSAQYTEGSQVFDEPYHQSFGTSYLGFRGEYDLLIEPAAWSRVRGFVGIGTRFWIRDLKDAVTPSGVDVAGYQETWWTVYPYIGLETKDSPDPGWQFFATTRIGFTPLTYQYATYFDTVAYPKCGLTGRIEAGMRFQKFSLSACAEIMTWAQSDIATDPYGDISFQPDSRMITVGAQLSYTF
jgi:hypothetical protein